MNNKKLLAYASLFTCAILYLIWPVAHTIALRKLLLVIDACIGVALWIRCEERNAILRQPWLVFLGVLLVWVVFHAGFLSQNGGEAWREFLGQWFPAYLAVLAGIGLALAGQNVNTFAFKIYLFVVVSIQPILFLLLSIYKTIQFGQLPMGLNLEHIPTGLNVVNLGTDLKSSLTFSSDMIAMVACAKFLNEFKPELGYKNNYLWLIPLALAMIVAIAAGSLNSVLMLFFYIILVIAKIGIKFKNMISRSSLSASVFLLTLVSIYFINFTPANSLHRERIISNIKVAVDIDTYKNWINYPKYGRPKNEMGDLVPESFYLRIAYASAALRTTLENPWGYGVTRKAFERLVQKKYPDAFISNAHNGYLNLSCAVGIPGLLLFVLALISIYRQLNISNSEYAHLAAWVIGINVIHWLLDAHERDHFFESYLFVIALLLTLSLNNTQQETYA